MEGVTMAGDDPVRICLEELRGSADIGAARRMARERGTALLGREGVASGLVAAALDADDGDREHAMVLFRGLIGEVGEDRADRGSLGYRFLEEAATSIERLLARDRRAQRRRSGPPAIVGRAKGDDYSSRSLL